MDLRGTDSEIAAELGALSPEVWKIVRWADAHVPASKRQVLPYQAAVLAYWARQVDAPDAMYLEVGTALGYSATVIATAAPHSMLITLNPKPGEFEKGRDNLRIRGNVIPVQKSSEAYLSTLPLLELYAFVFVDGNHSYEAVRHDSQYFTRLIPGGVILYHDYSPEGSARPSHGSYVALNELAERNREPDIRVVGTGEVGMVGWIKREGEGWLL